MSFSYDVIYLCMLLWHDCAFITNKAPTLIMGVRICYVLLTSSSYPLHSTADVCSIMMIVLNHIQKEAGFGVSQQANDVQASFKYGHTAGMFFVRQITHYLITSYISFFAEQILKNRR